MATTGYRERSAERGRTSIVRSIPAPTGGLNDVDPLALMPAKDALLLTNWFPSTGSIDIRKGSAETSDTGTAAAVKTLAEWVGADGTSVLIGASGTAFYNCNAAVGVDITGTTTPTEDRWQTLLMNNRVLFFNGADTPQTYESSGGMVDSTLASGTGTPLTPSNLIQATNYRDRLYCIEKDTCNLWYGASRAYQGNLTDVDLSYIFRRGGYCMYAATATVDDGGGADDRLVVCSSEGEVLVYEGSYPGGSDWKKTYHWFLPKPLGRNAYVNLDSDFLFLTEGGLLPISKLILSTARETEEIAATKKIQNSFRAAAGSYSAYEGWQAIVYPAGPYLLVNVPTASNANAFQYVMNTITKAWCKFIGMDACCWALKSGNLYFGLSDGRVMRADYGRTDDGAYIVTELKTAFHYFSDRGRQKFFNLVRPVLSSNGNFSFNLSVDTDFANYFPLDTVELAALSGSEWDVAEWDVAEWELGTVYQAEWAAVTGVGICAAIQMRGSYKNTECSLSAFDVNIVPGGYL